MLMVLVDFVGVAMVLRSKPLPGIIPTCEVPALYMSRAAEVLARQELLPSLAGSCLLPAPSSQFP